MNINKGESEMLKKYKLEYGFGAILCVVITISFAYGDPSPNNVPGTQPNFNVTFVHSSSSWSVASHNSGKTQFAEDGLEYLETPHPCYDISFTCYIDVFSNVLKTSLPSSIVDSYTQDLWLNEMCNHSFSRVALPYNSQIYDSTLPGWRTSLGYYTLTDGCDNWTIVLNGVDPESITQMSYDPTPTADWVGYNHAQFMHELAHTVWLQHMPTNKNIISSGVCIDPDDDSHGSPYPGIVDGGDSLDNIQAYYLQTFTKGLQGTPAPDYYPGGSLWPTPYCINPNSTPCPTP